MSKEEAFNYLKYDLNPKLENALSVIRNMLDDIMNKESNYTAEDMAKWKASVAYYNSIIGIDASVAGYEKSYDSKLQEAKHAIEGTSLE